jgi:NADH-quinone oxidoreductase subunit J
VFFLIVAGLLLGFANAVVSAAKPSHSVFCLIACAVMVSCLWIGLAAEFLGLSLLFVTVGAVMTLFLFIVMMLEMDSHAQQSRGWSSMGFGFLWLLTWLLPMGWMCLQWWQSDNESSSGLIQVAKGSVFDARSGFHLESNTIQLAEVLYTDYFWPFQLLGLVLLVALLITVGFVSRPPRNRKVQKIQDQIAVDPRQRVKLVDGFSGVDA